MIALAAALVALGAYFVHGVIVAPTVPALTFDEHTATATAILQPDSPTLPDLPRLSFIEQVEAYVALHAPKES